MEFLIDPTRRNRCIELMRQARLIYLRNGAWSWHLYEDLTRPNKFLMEVVTPSWNEYLRQYERMSKDDRKVLNQLYELHGGPDPPGRLPRVSVDKEVLKKRVGPRGQESESLA
jgi:transmembrane secretion effector